MYHYVIMLHGEKVRSCDDFKIATIIQKKIKGSKIMSLHECDRLPSCLMAKDLSYTDLRYKKYEEV